MSNIKMMFRKLPASAIEHVVEVLVSEVPTIGHIYERLNNKADPEPWLALGASAIAIAGDTAKAHGFLRMLLETRFADVPNELPPRDDVQAWARFSVKLLLHALTDDGTMRRAADIAWGDMCRRWEAEPMPLSDPMLRLVDK